MLEFSAFVRSREFMDWFQHDDREEPVNNWAYIDHEYFLANARVLNVLERVLDEATARFEALIHLCLS